MISLLAGCITVAGKDPQSVKNWEYAEKMYIQDVNNPKLTEDEKQAGAAFMNSSKRYEESKYDNKN